MSIEIPLIPFRFFEKINDLDNGGNGLVSLYKFTPQKVLVAIKTLRQYNEEAFKKEILPLLDLKHENIIKFYGVTDSAMDVKALVMEYMDGGDLSQVIHKSRYTLGDILNWNIQSLRALEYMHSFNREKDPKSFKYAHRDIKPQNMLLNSNRKVLKICDFGYSKQIESSRNTINCGTPLYMAPEVLTGLNYNEKCDVYSWALTFWECLTGIVPFSECQNLFQLGEKKKKQNYLGNVGTASPMLNRIIQSCSNLDRQKRLSIRSLRVLLENMHKNCIDRLDESIILNNICLWATDGNGSSKLYYCNGLNFENWADFEKDPLKIEEPLSQL